MTNVYDLVAFGMRGSVAGITHYEVQIKGDLIGNVWKRNGKWFVRATPFHTTTRLGPYSTRKRAIAAITDAEPR